MDEVRSTQDTNMKYRGQTFLNIVAMCIHTEVNDGTKESNNHSYSVLQLSGEYQCVIEEGNALQCKFLQLSSYVP